MEIDEWRLFLRKGERKEEEEERNEGDEEVTRGVKKMGFAEVEAIWEFLRDVSSKVIEGCLFL